MNLINYYNLDKQHYSAFVDFLKECSNETSQPAHKNMYDLDWENKNNTLLYILNKTSRYKTGLFNILFDNEKIVACSGCYTSDFSKDIAICGSRTWIHKDYRNKHIAREYMLPCEKSWAIQNNHKCVLLTFNDYNKNIIALWLRKRFGEHRSEREIKHFGYNGIVSLDYPVTINYTKQYILYEILDISFKFDWQTIKYE